MVNTRAPRQSDAIAASLATQHGRARHTLDRKGLVSLDHVIPQQWLTSARVEIDGYLAGHGSGEHSLIDTDRWECPTITDLATDERVEAFLHSLNPVPESVTPGYRGYRQRVLRILDGSAVDSPPFDWHYDANAVTMLVPIVVPADGMGRLAMFPDHRPHRRWATLSALERLLTHNSIYGRLLRRRYERDPSARTVPLTPGDAYLFRGYRALHATLPWPKDTLRVTLLLQYGHPYGAESPAVQAVRAWRDAGRKRGTGHRAARSDLAAVLTRR